MRSILLAPRNFRGHSTITAARRAEGQITTNERWSLFSELELSFFRPKPRNLEFSKKLVDGLFATVARPSLKSLDVTASGVKQQLLAPFAAILMLVYNLTTVHHIKNDIVTRQNAQELTKDQLG